MTYVKRSNFPFHATNCEKWLRIQLSIPFEKNMGWFEINNQFLSFFINWKITWDALGRRPCEWVWCFFNWLEKKITATKKAKSTALPRLHVLFYFFFFAQSRILVSSTHSLIQSSRVNVVAQFRRTQQKNFACYKMVPFFHNLSFLPPRWKKCLLEQWWQLRTENSS